MPRRLTHLPTGLGWGSEPDRASVAAQPTASLASTRQFGELAEHWMAPFEMPGTASKVPSRSGVAPGEGCGCDDVAARPTGNRCREPRITGPGGMDTLRDVTPGQLHDPPARPLIGVAPLVCPASFVLEWDVYQVNGEDLRCIHDAMQYADTNVTPRHLDCCDASTWDNIEAENHEWLDLFLQALRGCPPSVGVAGFILGDHGGSLHGREALRSFLGKNFGSECGLCIRVPCRSQTEIVDRPGEICLYGAGNIMFNPDPSALHESTIRVPVCTLKPTELRRFPGLPSPPRPGGPVTP